VSDIATVVGADGKLQQITGFFGELPGADIV
jgi:hypothetical protein